MYAQGIQDIGYRYVNDIRPIDDLIEDVEREMLERNVDIVIVNVTGSDEVQLMKNGFIHIVLMEKPSVLRYAIDFFVEKFTYEDDDGKFGDFIESKYMYANLEGWKTYARKQAFSFPLILYFNDYVFESRRQVTSMTYVKDENVPFNEYMFTLNLSNGKSSLACPVTRYAVGMSKGLYFESNANGEYCGTFFYHEPQSMTYLTFDTYRIFRNKYEATMSLRQEFKQKRSSLIVNLYLYATYQKTKTYATKDDDLKDFLHVKQDSIIRDRFYFTKDVPNDLRFTALEWHILNDPTILDEDREEDRQSLLDIGNRKVYVGNRLYALEDAFDQELCILAKMLDINVVILEYMAGQFQTVTEILDTRDRFDCLSNLTY